MTGIALASAWFKLVPVGFDARIAPLNALSNGKSPAPEPEGDRRRPHAGRAVCDVDLGPLSRPTTDALPGRRERVFMPHTWRSQCPSGSAQLSGKLSFVAFSVGRPRLPEAESTVRCPRSSNRRSYSPLDGSAFVADCLISVGVAA